MADLDLLSKRLIEVRKKNGYTRKQLAEELGRPYRTITNYETGEHEPGHKYLIEIAKKFGVTVDYLVGRSDNPHSIVKSATPYSDGAMKLADNYDHKLDNWGRQAIRDLMETEMARVADESRFQGDPLEDPEPRVINLFVEPSAAGIAVPTMGRDYEPYELKPDDPPGAAYAVRLQGNSMEPDFPDGSIVFVNHDALRDGDIGIFSVDGGTVCKQYHQEGGVVYLFSLNRRRSDADVVFLPGGNRSFICQGRVITRKRFPVPGRN